VLLATLSTGPHQSFPLRRARLGLTALALTTLAVCASSPSARAADRLVHGFHPTGRSMWIWYLDRSDGGDLTALAAQAHAANVATVMIKSSDGASWWSQFNPTVVSDLHRLGLHVCAWQYVYGTEPAAEAALGARAAQDGADCLVIDAEAEYEGLYAPAQTYMTDLRDAVGLQYSIGLASFPYVDYHPAFPYSVFLGPGGANFDMPQMYWSDIGTSVDDVYAHTYEYNRIYGRAIYPLGQTYGAPSPAAVGRFRSIAFAYDVPGISWFDFAWTSADALWTPISDLLSPALGFTGPTTQVPVLGEGSEGDDVLWLQEHLAAVYPSQRTTGLFAGQTEADLDAFQRAHHLSVTGVTDAPTWGALLALRPVRVIWAQNASTARIAGARMSTEPASASLPAVAYEVPEVGASHPRRPTSIAPR